MALTGPYEAVAVPVVSLLLNYGYEVSCSVWQDGQTLGKYLTGIYVRRDDGQPLTLRSASLLFLGKLLNLLVLADVAYGLSGLGGDGKCLHNLISGTTVVMKANSSHSDQHAQQLRL